MFIMATMIFPPKPTGLRVFSKNDILHLQFYTLDIGQRERGFQHTALPTPVVFYLKQQP